MSRSVTIPTVSPFLPETRTQPMLCLAISLATSAAVSDSFTVMTGRDMMSLTTTSSGSVSCTDKGSNRSDPTCIKYSGLWTRRVEGAEQTCHSRNGFLCHLDDFHDDSAKYCVKPSSFLASSVFSPSSGGVAGLGGPPVFSADRTVT